MALVVICIGNSGRREGRLVKVVTANAREILFFSLCSSLLFSRVSLFPLISSTSHQASRRVPNCELRLVIPSVCSAIPLLLPAG